MRPEGNIRIRILAIARSQMHLSSSKEVYRMNFLKYIGLSLIPLFLVANVWACADGPDYFRVVGVASWDTLNIRTGPGAKYTIIGEMPPHARGVENMGEQYPALCGCTLQRRCMTWSQLKNYRKAIWHLVRWTDQYGRTVTGWSSGRYLAEDW